MRESENTNPHQEENDKTFEKALRPKMFAEFTGQKKITDNLKVFIGAAKKRGEGLDHVLLTGPPGLGKTTLANIIANEMGVKIKVSSYLILQIKKSFPDVSIRSVYCFDNILIPTFGMGIFCTLPNHERNRTPAHMFIGRVRRSPARSR